MDDLPSFGRLLRQYRRARDLTQEELARRTACALTTIKKIESDERRPSRDLAERLAKVLAVPEAEIAAFLRLARGISPDAAPNLMHLAPPLSPQEVGGEDLRGHEIRGYVLRERLGIGGFGAVYRAVQSSIQREVAIKIILPRYANHPDFIRRFVFEAQLVARLEHPHIVPLYDFWREPDSAYLVMRYMRGGSLAVALRDGPLTPEATLQMLEQIGAALAIAHRANIVHRDLKPANILRDDQGHAYIADFGIAKDLAGASHDGATQAGAIVGSPDYLSPEQVSAEPVTPRTDIYSLGVMLFELLTATKPFTTQTPAELLRLHLTTPIPSLRTRRPELPEALDAIIQRATAKQPEQRYADVASLGEAFRAAIAPVSSLARGRALPPAAEVVPDVRRHTVLLEALEIENPYKGLRAFAEADARDFFGRNALIARLLERLAEETGAARFLAVVGPSGSGKSSIVRAGLIPALRQGGVPGSEQWFIADLIPGAHPLEELELALLRVAAHEPAGLAEQLNRDARGLLRAARLILPDDDGELVLVIDQFEELFTLVADETARMHLLDSLAAAISDPRSRLRIIVTLRADFYDRPLRYPQLGEFIRERTEVILPLSTTELEQAIIGPAMRAGLTVEPELVAQITHEVGTQPGALPLLQYALTELFERRKGRMLTRDAYQLSGGVSGALARRAEELFQGLDPAGQEAARQLFLRLITLGEGVEDTRCRIRREEYNATGGEAVIDTFGRHRLLTFDHEPITRAPTIEVAHEALIREWPRLRGWIDESRDTLRVQRRLVQLTAEWDANGHDASFLPRGAQLAQFAALTETSSIVLNANERAFVDAGLAERARAEQAETERQARELEQARTLADEQQRRADALQRAAQAQRNATRRLQYLVAALVMFLAAAIGLSALAIDRQRDAETQRGVAQGNLRLSEAQRIAAEANRVISQQGNATQAMLLAIRSMKTGYTPQGDEALAGAARMDYPVRQLEHPDGIRRIHFSPDSALAASAGNNGEVRIWEVATGRLLRTLQWHTDSVLDVRFSADGKRLVSCGFDSRVVVGEVESGKIIRVFEHGGSVRSCDFNPDATQVASTAEELGDRGVQIWDVGSGERLRHFRGDTHSNLYLDISPDGRLIAIGGRDLVPTIFDFATGKLLHELHGHADWSWQLTFTPDSRSVVTAGFDKTMRLWDVATGAEIRRFIHPLGGIFAVDITADGKYLLTGSDDHTARIWDLQTGKQLRSLNVHADVVTAAAIAPDGRTAMTSGFGGDRDLVVWDLSQSGELLALPAHTICAQQIRLPANERGIATAGCDAMVRLWDAQSGDLVREFSGHTQAVNLLAISPDGRRILAGSWDHTVRLWNTETGESRILVDYTNNIGVSGVAMSADGRHGVSAAWGGGYLNLFDLTTGQQVWQIHDPERISGPVAFAPDGILFAHRGDGDGLTLDRLFLRRVDTGEIVKEIPWSTWALQGEIAFSPDGAYLAGAGDRVVDIWNVADPAQHRQFIGHTDQVRAVGFTPDGRYLVSGSLDGTARIWDFATGQEVRRFVAANGGIVHGVVVDPTGRYVLTAHDDGWLRMWDLDYHTTIDRLCTRLLRDFTPEERAQYNIPDDGPTCPAQR